jgi:hypothetical protein
MENVQKKLQDLSDSYQTLQGGEESDHLPRTIAEL